MVPSPVEKNGVIVDLFWLHMLQISQNPSFKEYEFYNIIM